MSSSNKNKKSQSLPVKRYTTRQIMELTEKRRKQMDEEARQQALAQEAAAAQKASQEAQPIKETPSLESQQAVVGMPLQSGPVPASFGEVPAVSIQEIKEPTALSTLEDDSVKFFHEAIEKFTRQVLEHPARFEFPAENVSQEKGYTAVGPDTAQQQAPAEPAVNGKTVAAVFREEPQTPTEHAVSDLIEREFDKALNTVASLGTSASGVISKITVDDTSPKPEIQAPARAKGFERRRFKEILLVTTQWAFTISASVLLVVMFAHVLFSGWDQYYYDQSPFVLLMSLSALWLNRRHLEKRTQWFWGSTVIIAGGLGVFLSAALEGRPHIELAGFVMVCLGIFMWRYTEESALRLFFPLVCLLFVLAPPELWERMTLPRLNNAVYSFSADILNSFHLPVLFEESRFYVGPGVIDSLGDTMAFRSIIAFMPMAALCVAFLSMAGFWSIVLFFSVIFWGVVGNILRVTVTGLMLDNFGVEYASMFYADYSVAIVLVVMIAGLTLTAGLLPHRED